MKLAMSCCDPKVCRLAIEPVESRPMTLHPPFKSVRSSAGLMRGIGCASGLNRPGGDAHCQMPVASPDGPANEATVLCYGCVLSKPQTVFVTGISRRRESPHRFLPAPATTSPQRGSRYGSDANKVSRFRPSPARKSLISIWLSGLLTRMSWRQPLTRVDSWLQ